MISIIPLLSSLQKLFFLSYTEKAKRVISSDSAQAMKKRKKKCNVT